MSFVSHFMCISNLNWHFDLHSVQYCENLCMLSRRGQKSNSLDVPAPIRIFQRKNHIRKRIRKLSRIWRQNGIRFAFCYNFQTGDKSAFNVWVACQPSHLTRRTVLLIWDRHNLFEGRSPIILRGRREKGMYFFSKYFLNIFFNYLAGVISL